MQILKSAGTKTGNKLKYSISFKELLRQYTKRIEAS